MGRGLSELQKTILTMAYENHVREGITPPVKNDDGIYKDWQGLDISQSELLVKLFDFKVKHHYKFDGDERIIIDKTSTGEKCYNAGRATLSRTLKRLEDRGLILRWYIRTSLGIFESMSELIDHKMEMYRITGDASHLDDAFFMRGKRQTGLRLTEKGVETAKKLSVNTSLQCTKVLTDRKEKSHQASKVTQELISIIADLSCFGILETGVKN